MSRIIKRKILVIVGFLVSLFVGLLSVANAQGSTPMLVVTPTPTPQINWLVQAAEIPWESSRRIDEIGWKNNTVATVRTSSLFENGEFTVTLAVDGSLVTSQVAGPSALQAYSPKRTFVIQCGGGMRLERVADNQLISATPLMPLFSPGILCRTFIAWASDESAVSINTVDRSAYIWRTDGSAPFKITDQVSSTTIAWSPNSKRLALLRDLNDSSMNVMLQVFYVSGALQTQFQVDSGHGEGGIGWLTNDIVARHSQYGDLYFDANTGQQLFD
jgi:hypothetical protein